MVHAARKKIKMNHTSFTSYQYAESYSSKNIWDFFNGNDDDDDDDDDDVDMMT